MFRKDLMTTFMVGGASMVFPAYSQTEGPARQDVAVQAFGSFTTTTVQNGVDNSTTNSGGVLASYWAFKR